MHRKARDVNLINQLNSINIRRLLLPISPNTIHYQSFTTISASDSKMLQQILSCWKLETFIVIRRKYYGREDTNTRFVFYPRSCLFSYDKYLWHLANLACVHSAKTVYFVFAFVIYRLRRRLPPTSFSPRVCCRCASMWGIVHPADRAFLERLNYFLDYAHPPLQSGRLFCLFREPPRSLEYRNMVG